MKYLVSIILYFLVCGHSGATVIRPYASLQNKSTIYEFGGPEPLDLVRVKFVFKQKQYPLTLSSLEIFSGSKKFTIGRSDLGERFRPKMGEIYFYYETRKEREGTLDSFWIVIPYGKEEFIDCGFEGRVSTYKKKKIFVSMYNSPEVHESIGRYEHCEKLEEIKNKERDETS